jgi:REG-2-like HAD superfamily hydrolase
VSTQLISLDCASTLVEVKWQPSDFVMECAAELGLDVEHGRARSAHENLLAGRWSDYEQLNLQRDHVQNDAFWNDLTRDWLGQLGQDVRHVEPLMEIANRRLFGAESLVFSLYKDVIPALEALGAQGARMIVLSNWDYTLHKVLDMFNLTQFFEKVYASLEEGFEKPDPRFFHLAAREHGVRPAEVLHVGDNPVDDLQGARGAGMKALLLDRDMTGPRPLYISSLLALAEGEAWRG